VLSDSTLVLSDSAPSGSCCTQIGRNPFQHRQFPQGFSPVPGIDPIQTHFFGQTENRFGNGDYYLGRAVSLKIMDLTKNEIARLPVLAMESNFCRHHLKIDPMTFRRYFALGLIQPNAATSSGRPLFLTNAANVAQIRKQIASHKRQQRKLNAH
jgi:hypothetical protein